MWTSSVLCRSAFWYRCRLKVMMECSFDIVKQKTLVSFQLCVFKLFKCGAVKVAE